MWKDGFVPFCPHWSHFQHTFSPLPYVDWIEYDLHWLRTCDALLRLPGESAGADGEVAEAKRLGIPVFFSIPSLTTWANQ